MAVTVFIISLQHQDREVSTKMDDRPAGNMHGGLADNTGYSKSVKLVWERGLRVISNLSQTST